MLSGNIWLQVKLHKMLENLRYDDESMSMCLANQKQEEVAELINHCKNFLNITIDHLNKISPSIKVFKCSTRVSKCLI